jgi:hypothetical protein
LRWRLLAVLCSVLLLVALWRFGPRPAAAWTLLLFLPWTFALVGDTLAWGRLLRRSGTLVPFRHLLSVRLAADAAGAVLPSGAAVADATALGLLAPTAPPAALLGSLAGRRLLLLLAHACCLAAAGVLLLVRDGGEAFARVLLLASGSALLVTVAFAFVLACRRGSPVSRLHIAVRHLPSRRLRAALETRVEDALLADLGLKTAFTGLVRPWRLLPFVGLWLAEAVETWLFLGALGVSLPFLDVMSFEGLVSLSRGVVFFIPSGLLVQDTAYWIGLQALGVPTTAGLGAALALLKRGREVAFASLGALLLPWLVGGGPGHERAAPAALHLRVPEPDHADA